LITQNSDGSNGFESCEQKIQACWQKKDQQHVRLNQQRLESDEQQMLVFLKHTGKVQLTKFDVQTCKARSQNYSTGRLWSKVGIELVNQERTKSNFASLSIWESLEPFKT